MEQISTHHSNPIDLTAELVAAYVGNNTVRTADLPGLINSVHSALAGLGQPASELEAAKPMPAVSIKKSVTPDHLISLEDGKPYKTLKRHLTGRGMTPAEYRAKWKLPADYPMVAVNYANRRSELAKASGLGRKGAASEHAAPVPQRRGRKKAA